MLYNASFGFSWGPIPWLYPPEILPMSIRAKGASLSTAANWTFNWLVGEVTPILQDAIHWRLYLVHAFWCAVSFIVGELSHAICNCSTEKKTNIDSFQSGSSIPKQPTSASKT
jgi:hypothetical protein